MWQALYEELKDKGFMVVAVAQESRGAQFYFSSCDQARSIGKTVLRTVEEGYRPELDGNRNGIACEPADAL